MLSAIAATGLGLAVAVSTASPSAAATSVTGTAASGRVQEQTSRIAESDQCRTIDFDTAEVTPIASTGSVPAVTRYRLTVSGTKSASNVQVKLVPLTYIAQPGYWGILVTGCSAGVGLPVLTPYTVTYDLTGSMGSCGIEVVGATKRQQFDLANCRSIPLTGTRWVLDPTSLGVPVPAGASITANFSDTTVSGSTSCNTYRAAYTTDPAGAFKLGMIAMTPRACDPVTGTAESAYLKRLAAATQVQATTKELRLSAGGQLLLRFTPARATF